VTTGRGAGGCVEQDEVDLGGGEDVEGALAVFGPDHAETLALEPPREEVAVRRVVVHDEEGALGNVHVLHCKPPTGERNLR
jgi:hypothetical protein